MGLNDTASAERVHIGFFGRRNVGKSSLVNAVTGQELSLVSDVKGTTTDPVRKAMELLPLGPVVIIDTPGFDDEGTLGDMRVAATRSVINYVDIAVLVLSPRGELFECEKELIFLFEKKKIPYIKVFNKIDTLSPTERLIEFAEKSGSVAFVSAKTGEGVGALKDTIATLVKSGESEKKLVSDLIKEGDSVLLVVPIDSAAPKGRLILPQQQTIRDILDSGAFATVCRDTELADAYAMLKGSSNPPSLVITDSQAFGKVSKILPPDVLLTSFSILFARYKGNLPSLVKGAAALDSLKDGDTVLISEGCSHHRQCGDIGTVKLPKWISDYTGKALKFEFTSGRDFPSQLSPYSLIVHCGGCMLTEREMQYRLGHAEDFSVPMTNYGIVIAHTHGILARSLEPFPDILSLLK